MESVNSAKSRLEGELLSHRSELTEARRILVEILVEIHPDSLKPQSDGHASITTLLLRLQHVLREVMPSASRFDKGRDSTLRSEFTVGLLKEVEAALDRLESDDQSIWERSFVDLASLRRHPQITIGSIRHAARQVDAQSANISILSNEPGADSPSNSAVTTLYHNLMELLMNDRKALCEEITKLKEARASSSTLSISQRSGIQSEFAASLF